MILALEQWPARVHNHVHLMMPFATRNLPMFTRGISNSGIPDTAQAPHLLTTVRHLLLLGCALPVGSHSLTTADVLVTLYLIFFNTFFG